ncbi:diacylglycerol kinase 1 [Artemisia annua]|uniref:Diacylglycerol kinase 1 n=1 Tax=Artemisia annua TaxID=35608 RepID=A0A2U1M506_ARTAN|nr:diacylglycerol kinase 1 [Artemisia annua]
MVGEKVNGPAIVLDDDCINRKDLSFSLMGRVLEISSLANLKKALCNEGFDELKITYLGELWVMLEFINNETKESFWGNVGAKSWFSVLKHASLDFIPDGRMAWVEIDGIPFKFWSDNTFKRIAAKWGELMDMDDYDETGFHSKRLFPGWTPDFMVDEEEDDQLDEDTNDHVVNNDYVNVEGKVEEVPETLFVNEEEQNGKNSEDPFEIYKLMNKDKTTTGETVKVKYQEQSFQYPQGFTPNAECNKGNVEGVQMVNENVEDVREDNSSVNKDNGADNLDLFKTNSGPTRLGRSGSTSFSTGEIGGVEGPYGAVDRRLYMGFNMIELQLKQVVRDIMKASTLLQVYYKGVKKVNNVVSVIVGCQRHVLIANIGSYMGGVDLWHNKNEGADNFDPQSKHDNRLEVVSISATWHLGKLHGFD